MAPRGALPGTLARVLLVASLFGCEAKLGQASDEPALAGNVNPNGGAGASAQGGFAGRTVSAAGGASAAGNSSTGGAGAAGTSGSTGSVGITCDATHLLCASSCVATSDDNLNCGACGQVCSAGTACTNGQCVCAGGELSCNGACVDGTSNVEHCGQCATTCTTGQVCANGSCQCQAGLVACSEACVDLTSAAQHCGSCTNTCPTGNVCSNSACAASCAGGQTACNGSCVNVAADVSNCGACGKFCPAGQTCSAGQCQCASGQMLCGSQCVNAQTDSANCGGCGKACGGGRSCVGGACACTTSGQSFCNNSCVSTTTDVNNCGACGKMCASGEACNNGTCACPSGQTLCSGQCADTSTSAANCGACGKACGAGATCSSGTCSGGTTSGKMFSQCRFHFGAIDGFATKNGLPAQLDYFTPGWMGTSDSFDQSAVCTEAKGTLVNQVPVIVAYVAAFYAKRHAGLCDCNVTTCGTNNDLCHNGAAYISQNLSAILAVYKSYAQGYASCYGTTKPIVFETEPDFYQYTGTAESSPWSASTAASIMKQFVTTIKTVLPNAVFSMDISPWVAPNNGGDNGATWYGNFDMTQFTFINTSGGSTDATSTKIRSSNAMTWAGVSAATGKPILADTGYGVNGSSAGPDPNWDSVTNIDARMKDGVVGICQYNPSSSWNTTISGIRSQLSTPKFCP